MVSIPGEIQKRFDGRIRRITAAGIELPQEFIELQERLKSRHTAGTPLRDRYVAAIVSNDPKADLPALWAMSLAEASADNQIRVAVDEGVRAGVNERLRALYAPHAVRIYGELAAKFDQTAAAFTAASDTVDPDMAAEEVMKTGTEKQRKAWLDAEIHAQLLTRQLDPLRAAATLAGVGDDTNPDEALALVVDPARMDRAALWAAWDVEERDRIAAAEAEAGAPFTRPPLTPSRCGRWGALRKLGATIRAVNLSQFWAYERREPVTDRDAPPRYENTVHALNHVPDLLLNMSAQ